MLAGAAGPAMLAAARGTVDPVVVVVGILLLPLVAWTIALLVTGTRTAAGLRGAKLALVSVAAIVVAEILTKLALWLL